MVLYYQINQKKISTSLYPTHGSKITSTFQLFVTAATSHTGIKIYICFLRMPKKPPPTQQLMTVHTISHILRVGSLPQLVGPLLGDLTRLQLRFQLGYVLIWRFDWVRIHFQAYLVCWQNLLFGGCETQGSSFLLTVPRSHIHSLAYVDFLNMSPHQTNNDHFQPISQQNSCRM